MHMVINDVGKIMAIKITKGNIDDRTRVAGLTKELKGSICTDLCKTLYKKILY